MKTLFQRTVTRFGHLSDEVISRLINGELGSMREYHANAHMTKCWQCKARREALEKAAFQVVEYRKYQMDRRLPLNPARRESFLTRLDEVLDETSAVSWQSRLFSHFRTPSIPNMNPVYASTFVIVAAAVLLVLIWQRSAAPVSAAAFLDKAVQAEAKETTPALSAVIYQKIEIRIKAQTFERSLYRDVAQKRRARAVKLSQIEDATRAQLEAAGVNWQQPLSAENYRAWHDGRPSVEDQVRSSRGDLLTLTTSVPVGPIAAESLTVRTRDFHTVSRTISLRDDESIEIAEVHYDTLGWDAVNDSLFEPIGGGSPSPSFVAVVPHLPSAEQLDLAELQARLVLNRLHADSTEQLEFLRSSTSVEVKGIVETQARKEELVAQLRTVPHVLAAIFSVDDLSSRKELDSNVSSVRTYSTVAETSPLEQFLRDEGKGTETLSAMSQRLLDAAVSVKQESSAIAELYRRFGTNVQLDEAGRSTLQQLLNAHASRLNQAVDEEDRVLTTTITQRPPGIEAWSAVDGTKTSLEPTAASNLALCRELISGTASSQRDARLIATELFHATERLRNSIQGISTTRSTPGQAASTPSEKR